MILPVLIASAAASPRLLPDRALVLPPCSADADASCWLGAPTLTRFAAPDGLTASALTAQVRLAWSEGALLVFAEGLPAGGQIEVSLGAPDGVEPVWSAQTGAGLTVLPLETAAGQLRPMWLHLRTPDGDGVLLRPWSPAGAGDLQHAFPALLASAPALGFEAEIAGAIAVAPGADRVSLTRQRTAIPQRSRGVPPPWSTTDVGAVSLEVPSTGWYRLEATWEDRGVPIDIAAWRVYLEAAPVPLSHAGIFPVPSWHAPGEGSGLTLTDRATVCLEEPKWQAAAELLVAEVARLSGHTLAVKRRCRAGDITFTDAPVLPPAAASVAEQPEAFSIQVTDRAVIGAQDLRGAVYGALALADALGDAGAVAPITLADAPAVTDRILYHQLNLGSRGELPVEQWISFLEQVVARGRYNQLFLNLLDSYQFVHHPELAARNALTPAQLAEMLDAATALGIEVFPALSAPGHATWITRSHPELASGGQPGVLCPRDPAVYPLLTAVYEELLAAFNEPRRVHIGHDETFWEPQRLFGDERDPRCAGTPAWVLMEEDLRWHIDLFARHDAAVIAWSDMLVEEWNGGREGTWRAAESEELRASLTVAAWSKVGDSQGVLGGLGYPVIRLHTGYHDWKRAGLVPAEIAGEGLALFHPFPWMAAGINPGRQPLRFYWSQVLLAGATAWRPDLTATPIDDTLRAIAGVSAMRPGLSRAPGWSGAASPLLLSGAPLTQPLAVVPDHLDVAGVRFSHLRPVQVTGAQPARITVDRTVAGISILTAATLERVTRAVLVGQTRSPGSAPPLGHLTVTWADGETAQLPIRLGMETFDLIADARAISLWGSPGISLPSPEAADSAGVGHDRQVYRLDWHNPRPSVPVRSAAVTVEGEAALLVVGAASLDR